MRSATTGRESKSVVIRPRIFVRIHPKTSEPDVNFIKSVLGIDTTDPLVQNAYTGGHYEDIVTFDFSNAPELAEGEKVVWPNRAFRNAETWLSKRSYEQFEKIRHAGLCADLCVAGYFGLFPTALLEEVRRLGLDFWIFSV